MKSIAGPETLQRILETVDKARKFRAEELGASEEVLSDPRKLEDFLSQRGDPLGNPKPGRPTVAESATVYLANRES